LERNTKVSRYNGYINRNNGSSYGVVKYSDFETTLAEIFRPSFNDCLEISLKFNYTSGRDGATCMAVSFALPGRRSGIVELNFGSYTSTCDGS
jgi:hypothetical protein